MKRDPIGKIATDLSQKTPDSRDPVELQREMQKTYMKDLLEAVDRGYKKYSRDFFIHVETKNESLLKNVFRHYFIDRQTCPTPNYDQSVYKYDKQKGEIQYLWTIPDRGTAHHLKDNALLVAPEERELLDFVLKFADGTLFRLCKKLNGEKATTIELENG